MENPITSAPPALEGRGLVLTRQGRRILDGASLAIRRAETAVIEGPSGSGKSTLLRTLALLIEPDAGEISINGQSARGFSPRVYRTRVAYVPQLPPMFEGTVADNVAAGPMLRGVKLQPPELEALVDRVDLPREFLSRLASSLSGGERQRVALARALANRPEILLLDEPTSALDPAIALHVCALIRTLAGEGQTLAVVTHIEEHAAALRGTRYRCEAGRVIPRDGAP